MLSVKRHASTCLYLRSDISSQSVFRRNAESMCELTNKWNRRSLWWREDEKMRIWSKFDNNSHARCISGKMLLISKVWVGIKYPAHWVSVTVLNNFAFLCGRSLILMWVVFCEKRYFSSFIALYCRATHSEKFYCWELFGQEWDCPQYQYNILRKPVWLDLVWSNSALYNTNNFINFIYRHLRWPFTVTPSIWSLMLFMKRWERLNGSKDLSYVSPDDSDAVALCWYNYLCIQTDLSTQAVIFNMFYILNAVFLVHVCLLMRQWRKCCTGSLKNPNILNRQAPRYSDRWQMSRGLLDFFKSCGTHVSAVLDKGFFLKGTSAEGTEVTGGRRLSPPG